jgi:hypothetical protein
MSHDRPVDTRPVMKYTITIPSELFCDVARIAQSKDKINSVIVKAVEAYVKIKGE